MTFRDEFFIALNNWQNGWAESQERKNEYAIPLKEECRQIDDKYKIIAAHVTGNGLFKMAKWWTSF